MRREASSDRQNANPASALVNHDQGARREVGLVLVESSERLGWFSGWLRGGPLTEFGGYAESASPLGEGEEQAARGKRPSPQPSPTGRGSKSDRAVE